MTFIPKKTANLSLNSDLLHKARDLEVNLSATLEQALKDKLKSVEEERWKKKTKLPQLRTTSLLLRTAV